MEKTPQTPAQPSEINEALLDNVAAAGGVILERRGAAAVTDTDSARTGIIVHD